MRVLLLLPSEPARTTAGRYQRFLAPMPPITLAYLAAALCKAGITVQVLDQAVQGRDAATLERTVRTFKPDIVGLSVVTPAMPAAWKVICLLRGLNPKIRIVCGNIHADVFARELLSQNLADVVVHGEGEATLVDLVLELSRPSPDLQRVQGISFVQEGKVLCTGPRPRIEDLDSLPWPAWQLFPLHRYRLFSFARVQEPGTLILGSRGCPYGCTYCSLKIMGQKRRRRSAVSIADEMEHLYERYGYVQPSFIDPIFPFDKAEGLALAAQLVRRGLHRRLVWITESRTDLVDLELLQALREAGLRRIMFGFETPDPRGLRVLRKSTSPGQDLQAVHAARRAGLQVIGFFMLGIPGETPRSLRATCEYARALDLDFAKFSVFVPFPGTAAFTELVARGEIAQVHNWRRYTGFPTPENLPNYLPSGLSASSLIKAQRRAYASFYLRPRMVLHQLLRVRTLTLRDAADGLRSLCAP